MSGLFGSIAKAIIIIALLTFAINLVLGIWPNIPGFSLEEFKGILETMKPFLQWTLNFISPYIPVGFVLFLLEIFCLVIFPIGLTIRITLFIFNFFLTA